MKNLIALMTLALTACVTTPESGCHGNAYTGMMTCYEDHQVVGEHKMTPTEHQAAIQLQMLRQQNAMQMMMGGMNVMNNSYPPPTTIRCLGCDW